MSRDVWAERRELIEYLLKEHARRGGRVVAAPQTALYEPRVLDQLNITALVKQLQHGGTLELARVMLPASANGFGAGDRAASSAVMVGGRASSGVGGDNPFGPTGPAAAAAQPPPQSSLSLTTSASTGAVGVGGGGGGDNPFAQPPLPPAGSRHGSHISGDNPFNSPSGGGGGGGVSGGGGAGGVSGGGAPNPFAAKGTSSRPSNGTISAADGAMFSKKKGTAGGVGGSGEPPVTVLSTSVKLSYSVTSPPPPSQQQQQRPPLDSISSCRRLDGMGGPDGGGGVGPAGSLLPPRLDLPQLETGQTDEQLRDLAYLLFAAVAGGTGSPQHAALLPIMRQQLVIDDTRAADVGRVLRHLQPGGEPTLIDQPHPLYGSSSSHSGGWRPSQRASLELLLRLISVVRPEDFEAFKGFLRWKDVTVAVLERQVAAAVAAGWTGDKTQLKKMLARMHGAARRADVRGEGDFEEEEYGEATRVLADVAGQLAAGCSTGLRFPWAVRVRLCEILVAALFDTLEEGTYIDEAALVMQFLDSLFFPALGLSPSVALAVNAWVHFSMYVGTGCREQRLMKQLKQQISRLAAAAAEAPLRASDPFGLAAEGGGGPPAPPDELSRDGALAAQVANHIVDWVYSRLCDYHVAFPRGENLAALLDVFVFACKSRGDAPPRLCELLVEAVCGSAASAFRQQMRARMDPGASNEMRLLELASIVHDIHDADTNTFSPVLSPHLPAALAVAAARMHHLYGQHLTPWLAMSKTISPAVLDVFRTANVLEQRLAGSLATAMPPGGGAVGAGGGGGSTLPPAVADVLSPFRPWDLAGPLKTALLQWVVTQVSNLNTWTARALQTEKWKSMGSAPDGAHTASAAEVSCMTTEALDALYGMDVPMPSEVPQALLEGIDGVLCKYVTHVNDKLGALQRLIPPVPPLVRYKKDVVTKNEQAERDAGRSSTKGGKNKVAFLASVPAVESSPDFTNISASLTTEVLLAAACSLNFLYGRAEVLVQLSRERQMQSVAAHSAASAATSRLMAPPGTTAPAPASGFGAGAGGSPGTVKSSPAKSEGGTSVGEAPEPLTHARTALMTGMQYACKFLAARVVFWDGRTPWLELLYRHHVAQPSARMDAVLEGLLKVLAGTRAVLPDVVRTTFAKHLMVAAVQATERVLLDGGPCRWFMPADVQAIDQVHTYVKDLHKLRALFHADGEGLERELIDTELERVRRLLPLMKQEVGPLMDLLKTARTHGTAQLMSSSGGPGQAYDESTIMRVIVHRPERNGSKMLKSLYKLPKKAK
ncbi:hypothetical protein VOLCADRAFT_92175 [Volvox carteri f. nagariensis]|uniref:MHD2 domain-containing protein n=1 Tax=Volvox carteri f. nagariensis TaxID=3068 RepID=D8TYT5_VOLCA|nr:uncharacterized protein VOLCADRAFT_92175 [Volvox carteri f. nagariensis]EFJ47368.1 hypothetical protein VOLCADRAFT_92175 [Volvox carteri f. nagariensis]|eukprot:XP_002951557.1 hypothetical protein VOLCADRAFT_92175 [Volvox carteri f. nagariensis]